MSWPDVDVIVVGAGFGGLVASTLLARAGANVLLLDRHDAPQPAFRAEQLADAQIRLLRGQSLLETITRDTAAFRQVLVARDGRVAFSIDSPHYGYRYETMVARLRDALPPNVRFVAERVERVDTSPTLQLVRTVYGRQFTGRLIVIATGSPTAPAHEIPVRRRVLHEAHSIAFGFDIAGTVRPALPPPLLTYRPSRVEDGIDYLALFPIEGRKRANLFTYWTPHDPRVQAMKREPGMTLDALLPGLQNILGPFAVPGPVETRVSDLMVAEDACRDGCVLIGDAFGTTSPASGTGIARLLTDAERLAFHYTTDWATSSGMGSEKIARFYADPEKRACDNESFRLSAYMRNAATQTGWAWTLHRWQAWQRERLEAVLRQAARHWGSPVSLSEPVPNA